MNVNISVLGIMFLKQKLRESESKKERNNCIQKVTFSK